MAGLSLEVTPQTTRPAIVKQSLKTSLSLADKEEKGKVLKVAICPLSLTVCGGKSGVIAKATVLKIIINTKGNTKSRLIIKSNPNHNMYTLYS
jgi:hypothetical protein